MTLRLLPWLAAATVAVSVSAPSNADSLTEHAPDETDLARSHCAALREGAKPGEAFLYAVDSNLPKFEAAMYRQRENVWRTRIQLDAVEQGFNAIGGGTRSVVEAQIARAASGAPPGLTVLQATQMHWDAKQTLMELNHRAQRWLLGIGQEKTRLQAGIPISRIPSFYSVALMETCPELLK